MWLKAKIPDPGWSLFVDPDRYLADLLATRGEDDKVVDREVKRILWRMRLWGWWKQVIAKLRSMWVYGRHWRASKKIHGSPAQASGGSAGGATAPLPAAGTFSGGTPLPFEDAGIRAGEVTAYRAWRLKSDGLLYSCYQEDFVWPPGETVEGDPANAPHEGVHGFKHRIDAVQYIYEWEKYISNQPLIFVTGTVELWGEVYEHERGYRASKAKIASIDDSPNYNAGELRRRYNIKVDQ